MIDYVPYDDWIRNYGAMKDEKLTECVIDFRTFEKYGMVTPAVQRVMDHGGDINDNMAACISEAGMRGITEVRF